MDKLEKRVKAIEDRHRNTLKSLAVVAGVAVFFGTLYLCWLAVPYLLDDSLTFSWGVATLFWAEYAGVWMAYNLWSDKED